MVRVVVLLGLVACGHVGFDPIPAQLPPDAGSDATANGSRPRCVSAISAVGDAACALRTDGRVACWGSNSSGDLGDGTIVGRRDPAPATGLTDAIGLAAGEFHACAVRQDRSASCWGNNDTGQVGDGTISPRLVPTPVFNIASVAQIATGQTHTCARHMDGSVSCWGKATAGAVGTLGGNVLVPRAVVGIANTTDVAVGDNITCAITADRAQCWGDDVLLGDGTLVDRATPGPVALPDMRVVDIRNGCHRHACALLEDGSAWCWGDNTRYQLGDGTKTTSRIPVRVGGGIPFTKISVGAWHACAIDAGGNAWCWGDNALNQIDDAAVPAIQPRRIPLAEPVEEIEAACTLTCARAGDRVWCWGSDGLPDPTPRTIHEIAIPCT